MVRAQQEALAQQVMLGVVHEVYYRQEFFAGGTVVPLGFGQRAASIGHNPFSMLPLLGEDGPYRAIAGVRVQDEASLGIPLP